MEHEEPRGLHEEPRGLQEDFEAWVESGMCARRGRPAAASEASPKAHSFLGLFKTRMAVPEFGGTQHQSTRVPVTVCFWEPEKNTVGHSIGLRGSLCVLGSLKNASTGGGGGGPPKVFGDSVAVRFCEPEKRIRWWSGGKGGGGTARIHLWILERLHISIGEGRCAILGA